MAKKQTKISAGGVSNEPGTRDRILGAAWSIIDAKGAHAASVREVAKLAGLSRQAIYLHFTDRSELLNAVGQYIDEKVGLYNWMEEAAALADVESMLRRIAETRVRRGSIAASVVRSVEADRFRDDAAATAWKTRHEEVARWMERTVVRRLQEESRLHASWIPSDAASMLVALFSFRMWDDLTQARGWSAEHYVETLVAAALSMFGNPSSIRHGTSTQRVSTKNRKSRK